MSEIQILITLLCVINALSMAIAIAVLTKTYRQQGRVLKKMKRMKERRKFVETSTTNET